MTNKTISPQQKRMLLEFLEDHPQLLTQKQSNQFTNADTCKHWQEVSNKLNCIPGAIKTWKEWRKVSVELITASHHYQL